MVSTMMRRVMYPRRKIDCLPLDLRPFHRNRAHVVYKTNWMPGCENISGFSLHSHSNTHRTQHQKENLQQGRHVLRRYRGGTRRDHNTVQNPFWTNVGQTGRPGLEFKLTAAILISILPAPKPNWVGFPAHEIIIEFGCFLVHRFGIRPSRRF